MHTMVEMPEEIERAILNHARFCFPAEACGLLAADAEGRLRMFYALTNADRSSTSYTLDPTEHFRAMRHAESRGWSIAGVVHSHPHSAAFPSPTDRRLAPDPEWLYVIAGPVHPGTPQVRAFTIREGAVREVPLSIVVAEDGEGG